MLCSSGGKGCVEIKYPSNQKDNYISEAIENDIFYLTEVNNSIKLLVTHQYYYQIQTHIHVSKSNFRDIFIWTKKDYHTVRIYPDENLWSEIVTKCNHFLICL